MTSVKNFSIEQSPTDDRLGRGLFEFTDAYSVFDWGKMPDEIPDKGAALCTMGAFNFELLEAAGVGTHYRGVTVDDEVVELGRALDGGQAPRNMAIELTTAPELPYRNGSYDYDTYYGGTGEHYLVPLEIVFRNEVPVGSSLRSRSTPADVGLSYDEWPEDAVSLDRAVVEFSTKYEQQDRYLTRKEADEIAGPADLEELEAVARRVNRVVTDQAERTGFVHQDGKIECLYVDGEIRVADVVGTFDENRFSYDGQQISKEVVRQYHKHTQPEWVQAVSRAKERARTEGIADWKSLCERRPEPLDSSVIQVARDIYCSGTNTYLDRTVFEAAQMDEAVTAARNLW